jgi:HEAT repeat protein
MNWLSLRFAKKPEARLQLIAEALAERSDQAFNFLVTSVQDEDAGVRLAAVQALGEFRRPEASQALLHGLVDSELNIRMAVVEALVKIGGAACRDVLVTALIDPSFEIRRRAVKSLETLKWHAKEADERAAWLVARGDFNSAVKEGAAAIAPLQVALNDENYPARRAVAEALGKITHEDVAAVLIGALRFPDSTLRIATLEALGNVGDLAAVDSIKPLLTDTDARVREAAAKALIKLPDINATQDLIHALRDSHISTRKAAAEALGKIKNDRAAQPISALLQDPAPEVRAAAVEALGAIGSDIATEGLILAMVDPQLAVRQAAVDALTNICPDWEDSEEAARALPELKSSMRSRDFWVRYPAADVLNRIITAQDLVIPEDIAPLLERHNETVETLIGLLHDRDRDVRQAVAEALRRIADSRSVQPLVARLEDPDPWVKRSVSRALETFRWKADDGKQPTPS